MTNSRSSPPLPASVPALEGGEEVAVEAAAVREALVRRLAVVGQHRVGEVVVLVDERAEGNAVVGGIHEQLVELAVDGRRGADAPDRRLGEQVRIPLQRAAQSKLAVLLEVVLQTVEGGLERGEVEAQDDVAVTLLGGPPADVGTPEHGVELVGPRAVVVVLQHRHPAGLAEAARPDQDGVVHRLQRVEKPRLVHVEPALHADAPEVGQAVGYAGVAGLVKRHVRSFRRRARLPLRRIPSVTIKPSPAPFRALSSPSRTMRRCSAAVSGTTVPPLERHLRS